MTHSTNNTTLTNQTQATGQTQTTDQIQTTEATTTQIQSTQATNTESMATTTTNTDNPISTFAQLQLAEPILKAVAEQGYDTPTPIQRQCIPAVLAGRDVMAAAQTGTGKTAGFTLPLLQKLISSDNSNTKSGNAQHQHSNKNQSRHNQTRALIITPTRELAAQIADNVTAYSKYLPIKSTVVFGGVKINPQMQRLRGGTDILIATPGRLLDLYQQNAIRFDELEVLVLDEADRMLDMGFIHDIKKIIRLVPKNRQNLLFSATFADEIRELAKALIHNPVEISVTPKNSTAEKVSQLIHPVDKTRKPSLLIKLIKDNQWFQVLVFTRTKHGANRLAKQIEKAGITAAAIHGNKSQGARTRALADFKAGEVQVLVATDIAARGIDIDLLPFVVNFDLPNVAEDYVHRIGRTGRAGSSGQAVSLVSAEELKFLKAIERLTQQVIPRQVIAGFEPQKPLTATALDTRPVRKRPKKNKANNQNRSRQGNNNENKSQPNTRNGKNRSDNSNETKNEKSGNENRNNRSSNPDKPSSYKPRRKPNNKQTNTKFANKSNSRSNNQNTNNRRARSS